MVLNLDILSYDTNFLMRFFYTNHAIERMLWRNVSKETVEDVVNSPDVVEKGEDSKLIASKIINQERVVVVYIQKEDKILVVTVMTR